MEQHIMTKLQEDINNFKMSYDIINENNSIIMNKAHYHETYEIYYQLCGEKYFIINDNTYHIKKGDIILIKSYDLHKTKIAHSNTTERIIIRLNDNFINTISTDYTINNFFSCFSTNIPVLRLNVINHEKLHTHFFKMLDNYEKFKNNLNLLNILYMKILTLELLILLNQIYEHNLYNNFELPNNVDQKIYDAITYLNSNFMYHITLDTISSQFYISKYHFIRLFKKSTGFTVVEYLNILRLEEAKHLLLETNLPISKVSVSLGYSEASYFCKIFKKHFFCSPIQFRNQNKSNITHIPLNDFHIK
jgi:AraC-like DNA-binding protein